MKKILLLFVICSFTLVVSAQKSLEDNVAKAVEKLRSAMLDGNRLELEAIASKNLTYGHSSGKLENFAAFVETIAGGKSDFVTLDFTKQTIKLAGKTALVRHEFHAKTNDSGKPGEVHLGVLLVWQKEGKDWKLLDRQSFKLP